MSLPSSESEKISINKSSFTVIIVGAVIAIAVASFFAGLILGDSSPEANSNDLTNSSLEEKIAKLEAQIELTEAPEPTPAPSNLKPSPSPVKIDNVSLDDDPVKGDPDAPITIVEFSDFQCPFCARWYTDTLSQISENYIDTGKAKLVYRDLPLERIHPNAKPAHIAAECADEQKKFWDYHDILFERQAEWNRLSVGDLSEKLNEYAATLELDTSSFESCLSSDKISDEITADLTEARTYGATGTPTFFVGNEEIGFTKLVGAQPYQSFKYLIDGQIKKLGG